MAIFYIDYDLGSDSNNGTTWGLAWKTISGGTAARIAPGDIIRVAKSPDPVDTGKTATWTSARMVGNTSTITSSTNTSPIVVTTAAAHGLTTGDWIQIASHVTNTPVNGQWKVTVVSSTQISLDGSVGIAAGTGGNYLYCTPAIIEMSEAVTQTISTCDTAWTAAIGTSTLVTTNHRQGSGAVRHQHGGSGGGVTANMKLAYLTLPSALDLSGYQQISFYFMNDNASAATNYRLCLCSDTLGATVVHDIPIEANPNSGFHFIIVKDFGTALSSSIQSIALYTGSVVPIGGSTYIDNIIASKASSAPDAITLASLVSSDNVNWWPIKSITGNVIRLETDGTQTPQVGKGYFGPSGTQPVYRRETVKMVLQAGNTALPFNSLRDSGTAASKITLIGGYNTATTLADGHTVLDLRQYSNAGINLAGQAHWDISGISIVRANNVIHNSTGTPVGHTLSLGFLMGLCGINLSGGGYGNRITVAGHIIAGSQGCVNIAGQNNVIEVDRLLSPHTAGVGVQWVGYGHRVKIGQILGCSSNGVQGSARDSTLICNQIAHCNASGVSISGARNTIRNTSFTGNTTADVTLTSIELFMTDCSFSTPAMTDFGDGRLYAQNYNGVAGQHKLFTDGMTTTSQQAVVTRGGGWAWQATPTSTTVRVAANPIYFPLAKVAVSSGTLVTATLQVRRTNAITTYIAIDLVCLGGQIAGVASEVAAAASAAADIWETLTITFTPSAAGVVELHARISGVTGQSAFFTDLTVEQA